MKTPSALRLATKIWKTKERRRLSRRRAIVEQLETRQVLASDWQNPLFAMDVGNDQDVSPLDVLALINDINTRGVRQLPEIRPNDESCLDVDGDGGISPLDVLSVINFINQSHPVLKLQLQLTNDTGDSQVDLLTRDGRVQGDVLSNHGNIVEARIQFDDGPVLAVPKNDNGTFVSSRPSSLDGFVRSKVFVRDEFGAYGFGVMSFQLDTTPPKNPNLDLATVFDSLPLADHVTTFETVSLVGQSDADAVVELLGNNGTLNVDGLGGFSIDSATLSQGSTAFTVRTKDAAGNSVDATSSFYRPPRDISLTEKVDRVSRTEIPLWLESMTGVRTLSFDVSASALRSSLGAQGSNSFPDTLSVYLMDSNGKTLLDRGVSGTPFFAITERGPSTAPSASGVSVNGDQVTVDLSTLRASNARLVFELFNGDNDLNWQVNVSNILMRVDGTATPEFRVPDRSPVIEPGPNIDRATVELNLDSLDSIFDNFRIDPATKIFTLDARIHNRSGATAGRDLAMILGNLPAGMTLLNRTGDDPLGPYVNFRNAIPAMGLPDGVDTQRVQLRFSIDDVAAFSFEPSVNFLARSNALELFQVAYNKVDFQPYRGAMKGLDGIRDTKSGNAWDQSTLFIDELLKSGLNAEHVFGRIEISAENAMNWIGATTTAGALQILQKAGLNPATILGNAGSGPDVIAFQLDHAWVQTRKFLPGSPVINIQLDPSLKPRVRQPGIPNLSTLVAFDEAAYLGNLQPLQPHDYYVDQVAKYLQVNHPGKSLSDVPTFGGTKTQIVEQLPPLPFQSVSTPVIRDSIPYEETARVIMTLDNLQSAGGAISLQYEFLMPRDSHSRISISWRAESLFFQIPELRVDGRLVATGTALPNSDSFRINIQKYLAGDLQMDDLTAFDFPVGKVFAIGFNVGQIGPQLLLEQRTAINAAGIDHLAGRPVDYDKQVGALLSLTALSYWDNTSRAEEILSSLTQGQRRYNYIESGFAQLDSPIIEYHTDLPIIAIPKNVTVNIPQPSWEVNNLDGSTIPGTTINDRTRDRLIKLLGSTEEQHVLEQLFNVNAICAVSAIQFANANRIPVFTINKQNKAELFPQLVLPDNFKSAMEFYIDNDVTVITPKTTLKVGNFDGVGYLIQTDDGFFGALVGSAFGGIVTEGPFPDEFEECHCPVPEDLSPGDGKRGPTKGNQFNTGTGFITSIPQSPPPPAGGDIIKGLSPAGPNDVPPAKTQFQGVAINDGSLIRENNDVDLPNIGIPLLFKRQYDSQLTGDVGLGLGWTHTYAQHLEIGGVDETVTWVTENGREYDFEPILETDNPRQYKVPPSLTGTFKRTREGFYIYTEASGTHYDFAADGNLLVIFDRHDYGVILKYDHSIPPLLSSVVSNADQSRGFTLQYNSRRQIVALHESTGRSWTYQYNDRNLLVRVKHNPESVATAQPTPQEWHYSYYGPEDDGPTGFLQRIDDADGDSESYLYYPNGMLMRYIESSGGFGSYVYELESRRTIFTNEEQDVTIYQYDAIGLYTSIQRVTPGGFTDISYYTWERERLASKVDFNGHSTTNIFDGDMNVTERIEADGTRTTYTYGRYNTLLSKVDALGRKTTYSYNSRGDLISEVDPLGNVTTHTYDRQGRGLRDSTTWPNGHLTPDPDDYKTQYAYNIAGQVTMVANDLPAVETMQYDVFGNLVRQTDALGRAYSYAYDTLDRRVEQIDPMGQRRAYHYDRIGDLVMITDELGRNTAFRYDYKDLTNTTTYADGTSRLEAFDLRGNRVLINDENNNETKFYYDQQDRLIETRFADGSREFRTYDGERNLASITDPKGDTTRFEYDARDRIITNINPIGGVTRYRYDDVGNLVKTIDPKNRTSTIAYDALNRPIKTTDALGNSIVTAYDANGNATQVTDAAGNVSSLVYDVANRLVKTIDPSNHFASVQYDVVGNILAWTDENGHTTLYEYDPLNRNTAVVDPRGGRSEDSMDAVGRVIERKDRLGRIVRFEFDQRDRLLQATDPLSGIRSYAYDRAGNVLSFTDELGRSTQYEYDSLDRRTTMTNPLGGRQNFVYDPAGNLIATTDELGRTTQYTYDPLDRLTSTIDAINGVWTNTYDSIGNLTSRSDALGRITQYVYDDLDRVVATTDALGGTTASEYDSRGNLARSTDSLGRAKSYTYDSLNRLLSTTDADAGITSSSYDAVGNLIATTDPRGNITRYEFDELNRLTTTIDAIGGRWSTSYDAVGNALVVTDANNHATTLEYDGKDRLIRSTDALGGATEYTYDLVGNQLSIRDALGRVTRFEYDDLDRLTQSTNALGNSQRLEYDAVGNVLVLIDALGHETTYTYDSLNRPTHVRDALGQVTRTTYDAVGNRTAVRDRLDRNTTFRYDNLDRLTQVRDPLDGVYLFTYDAVGNLKSVQDPLDRTTRYQHDPLDRVVKITDPLGFESRTTYDANGNMTASTDALGREFQFRYDKLNRQIQQIDALGGKSTFAYDAVGNTLSTTDELDRTSQSVFDERNRLVESIDPLGQSTRFEYDILGNRLSTIDPLGHATRYKYDELNRQVEMIDPLGGSTSYSYDENNRLTFFFDPNGNGTRYFYDELNRVTTESNTFGAERSFQYDAEGNVTEKTDRNGRRVRYAYDVLDRNTQENWLSADGDSIHSFFRSYDAASQLLSVHDSLATDTFAYDANGRLTNYQAASPVAPDVLFAYGYDSVGNLLSKEESIAGTKTATSAYTRDELNRTIRISQSGLGVASKRIDFGYDAASQMTRLDRYSDLPGMQPVAATSISYNLDSRVKNIKHARNGTNPPIAEYGITYDAASRITQLTSPDGPKAYNYDERSQLVQADQAGQSAESYAYDANGNRIGGGYTTARDNRLTSDGVFNYEYDAEGNRTRRTNIATGSVTEYEWDYRNRLTRVVTRDSASGPVTSQSEYTYNSFDERVGKRVDSDGPGPQSATETRYVVESNHIALQFDGSGNITHRYLYGPEVDQVLADEAIDEGVLWPLFDHLGTVRDLVDSTGTIANHLRYDSFGKRVAQTQSTVDHIFGYTGREFDEETGLLQYRARYYDPAVGRFLSQDPIGFAAGDANLYRYVDNNPLTNTDPNGLAKCPPELKGQVEQNEGGESAEALGLDNESIRNAGPSTAKQYGPSSPIEPPSPPPPPPAVTTWNGDNGDGSSAADSFRPTITDWSPGTSNSPPRNVKPYRSILGTRNVAGSDELEITGVNGEPVNSDYVPITKESLLEPKSVPSRKNAFIGNAADKRATESDDPWLRWIRRASDFLKIGVGIENVYQGAKLNFNSIKFFGGSSSTSSKAPSRPTLSAEATAGRPQPSIQPQQRVTRSASPQVNPRSQPSMQPQQRVGRETVPQLTSEHRPSIQPRQTSGRTTDAQPTLKARPPMQTRQVAGRANETPTNNPSRPITSRPAPQGQQRATRALESKPAPNSGTRTEMASHSKPLPSQEQFEILSGYQIKLPNGQVMRLDLPQHVIEAMYQRMRANGLIKERPTGL